MACYALARTVVGTKADVKEVEISLPSKQVERIEALARKGRSRDAIIAEALDRYLASIDPDSES